MSNLEEVSKVNDMLVINHYENESNSHDDDYTIDINDEAYINDYMDVHEIYNIAFKKNSFKIQIMKIKEHMLSNPHYYINCIRNYNLHLDVE